MRRGDKNGFFMGIISLEKWRFCILRILGIKEPINEGY